VTSIIMTIALVQNGITVRGVTLVPEIVPDLSSNQSPPSDLTPSEEPTEDSPSDDSGSMTPR
jgi:hypothetical protein